MLTIEERRAARSALIEQPPPAAPEPVEDTTLAAAEPEPLVLSAPGPDRPARRQALTEKHRPRTLAQVMGQPEAVRRLSAFAAAPYPTAFVLAGDTGTGKTSAAWALAADLGCDIDAQPVEFGGVESIPSGEHTPAVLQDLWPKLWTMPFQSRDGWRVLIVNEVERIGGKVELLWLDRLEDMPSKLVIVFTTNDVSSLPDRFLDRCIGGVIEFASAADDLGPAARDLAAAVWREETGGAIPPAVLEEVTTRAIRAGRLSFRRVVQALVPLIAAKGR